MTRPRTLLLALGTLGAIAWMKRKPGAGPGRPPSATTVLEDAADAPNAAERLQAAGLAGVRGDAELSSRPSPEASRPGLPEFFRGA